MGAGRRLARTPGQVGARVFGGQLPAAQATIVYKSRRKSHLGARQVDLLTSHEKLLLAWQGARDNSVSRAGLAPAARRLASVRGRASFGKPEPNEAATTIERERVSMNINKPLSRANLWRCSF